MELTDPMLNYVWKKIESMKEGEILEISSQAPNNPSAWVECAKKYQDLYDTILFSDDYSKIKKVKSFKELSI